MVGHHKHAFPAEAQAFLLHGGRNHGEGFAAAHHVGQQGIAAVNGPGNTIDLMGSQGVLGIHAVEFQV